MKLPSFKRLVKEDFPQEFGKLIDVLASNLNNTLDVIYQANSRRLSLQDNLLSDVKTFNVTVDSNGEPTNLTTFPIANPNIVTLSQVIVGNIKNLSDPEALLVGGVTILYSQTNTTTQVNNVLNSNANKTIIVDQITGLIPGDLYQITVTAWG